MEESWFTLIMVIFHWLKVSLAYTNNFQNQWKKKPPQKKIKIEEITNPKMVKNMGLIYVVVVHSL